MLKAEDGSENNRHQRPLVLLRLKLHVVRHLHVDMLSFTGRSELVRKNCFSMWKFDYMLPAPSGIKDTP